MRAHEPTVALVFSPEAWVEELHRHLSHHGGARVRQVVVEPSIALEEEYDILVVSDRWPALTHGFVGAVHLRGRSVLGVFDAEEPAGKDHLVRLGVDGTLASDASVDEFVSALRELDSSIAEEPGVVAGGEDPPVRLATAPGALVVVSGPRGSGVTEIALGVATALAERRCSVLLVDAHDSAPALAGRLGLGLEPNLGTAVDACAHGLGVLDSCLVPVPTGGPGRIRAICGHPSATAAAQVSSHDVLDVVRTAIQEHEFVVVDTDERSSTGRAVLDVADVIVGVMQANPVGVVRGIEWIVDAIGANPSAPVHVMVNRAPRGRFRQEEIRSEIQRTVRPASVGWCPDDARVVAAAWDGVPVTRGALHTACVRMASVVAPEPRTRSWRWTR